jgi:hypothetical protein
MGLCPIHFNSKVKRWILFIRYQIKNVYLVSTYFLVRARKKHNDVLSVYEYCCDFKVLSISIFLA